MSSGRDESAREGVSRRAALAGAAGALLAWPLGTRRTPLAQAAGGSPGWAHGSEAAHQGADIAVTVGRNQQGRFGLMFPSLKPYAPPDAALADLAQQMLDLRPPASDPSSARDGFDNFGIPAGYTFFGQFLDHDITHDPMSLEQAKSDPKRQRNFNTPFLDLDSMYGRGPSADPHLYDPARPGYLAVELRDGLEDLPRVRSGEAIVGDPRNDENIVIAQMHAAFACLHNRMMDSSGSFDEARRQTVWRYQWVVVNDFLPRVCGIGVVRDLLALLAGRKGHRALAEYKPRNPRRPMMPLEFAVAAYRFGHSMIRPEYELHDNHTKPVFGRDGGDLRGGRRIEHSDRVDWSYFFDVPGHEVPEGRNWARLVDAFLSLPLNYLPPTVVGSSAHVALAERNLLRAKRLGLPCGQDVAKALRQPVLTNKQLGLKDPRLGDKAPLWFYVLKESELTQGGRLMGPVGARIVATSILGFLALDPNFYLNQSFTIGPDYDMGRLLAEAGVVERGEGMGDVEEPETEDGDTEVEPVLEDE